MSDTKLCRTCKWARSYNNRVSSELFCTNPKIIDIEPRYLASSEDGYYSQGISAFDIRSAKYFSNYAQCGIKGKLWEQKVENDFA